MKNTLLTAVALTWLSAVPSHAQTWEPVTIPAGGLAIGTNRIATTDGTHLYVLGSSIHRSTDGSSWETLDTVKGTTAYVMSALPQDFITRVNGRIWVGNDPGSAQLNAGYNPIHRLESGETEWTRSAISGFPGSAAAAAANSLAYDASTGRYYAASALGGVYTSDNALDWQRQTTGLGTGTVIGSGIFAKNGVALLSGPNLGVQRSTDGGVTWSAVPDLTGASRDFIEINGRVLHSHTGTASAALVSVTENLGASWVPTSPPQMVGQLDLTTDGTHVFGTAGYNFVAGAQMLTYSATGGLTWGLLPSDGLPKFGFPGTGSFVPLRVIAHGAHVYAIGYLHGTNEPAIYRIALASLNLAPTFAIVSQPQPVNVFTGGSATFRVLAGGKEPLSYAWKRGTETLGGGPTLTLSALQVADSGNITVEVRDADNNLLTSTPAALNVVERADGRYDPFLSRTGIGTSGQHGTLYPMPDGSMAVLQGNYAFRIGPDGGLPNARGNFGGTGSSGPDYPVRLVDSAGRFVLMPKSSPATNFRFIRRVLDGGSTANFGNDTSFSSNTLNPSAAVSAACEVPGRGYLVAGPFTTIGSTSVNRLALINYDGTSVSAFCPNPLPSSAINGVFYSAHDQSVWVSGDFFYLPPPQFARPWPGSETSYLVKLDTAGNIAADWTPYVSPVAGGTASILTVLSNGKVLIREGNVIQRLNADGTRDSSFNPTRIAVNGTNGVAIRAVEEANGRIILAGGFTAYGSEECAGRYCRLNVDGSFDATFYSAVGFSGTLPIQSVAYDPRGYVYLSADATASTSGTFQGVAVGRSVVRVFATPASSPDPVREFLAAAGVPENLRGDDDDADGDGVANLIEYLYQTNPVNGAQAPRPFDGGSSRTGSQIHPSLDPVKTYRVIEVTLPKDRRGLTAQVQVSTDLTNFGAGPASAIEFGTPVDNGTTETRTYYLLPAQNDAPSLFYRLMTTR
jgi:hypothetical protein